MKYIFVKNIRAIFGFFAVISFIFLISNRHKIKYKIEDLFRNYSRHSGPCESCDSLFTDGVKVHQIAYKKEKIRAQKTDHHLDKLAKKGTLKNITDNENYLVRNMDYAKPILMPKAVSFLNKFSNEYRTEIDKADLEYIPFEITSATRSIESVKRLRKYNKNSITQSAHLNGKTFDISYHSFADYPLQRQIFIRIMNQYKKNGLCFIKHEIKQGCLHITVN